MSEPINLNKDSFDKAVSVNDKPALVDFWAPWCGPCKALSPILEELSSEMGDQVNIYKVNVDENTELSTRTWRAINTNNFGLQKWFTL